MYWLDSTILAVLAVAAVLGAYSGLLMQGFRLIGFPGSLDRAICLHAWAADHLRDTLMRGAEPQACHTVGFAGVFLGIYLGIFLVTLFLQRSVRAAQLQAVNRGLGALLGVLKMSLLLG